jgi:acid phosphatase (class A)
MRALLLAGAALAVSAAAGGPPRATAPFTPALPPVMKFLTPDDIDPARLLPPPPSDASVRGRAELAELKRIEARRTAAAFAAAKADEVDETPTAFAAVFGPRFDLTRLPATARMLADVRNDQKIASDTAKAHFKRNRPWILDPHLRTCSRADPPQSSYPSGHSSFAFATLVVLAAAAPDHAPALLARAEGYAQNRLVCSMHFRSDIVAGQALGTAVAVDLLHIPAFRAELAASHRELVGAHLTAGP